MMHVFLDDKVLLFISVEHMPKFQLLVSSSPSINAKLKGVYESQKEVTI